MDAMPGENQPKTKQNPWCCRSTNQPTNKPTEHIQTDLDAAVSKPEKDSEWQVDPTEWRTVQCMRVMEHLLEFGPWHQINPKEHLW
eukprot:jgi/Psemu1/313016/fgenesh1_kg.1078_\